MVNPEYLEKVRQKYGNCNCGDDIEYVITKETSNLLTHINMFGELSFRAQNLTDKKIEIIEVLCHPCYYKKYEKNKTKLEKI